MKQFEEERHQQSQFVAEEPLYEEALSAQQLLEKEGQAENTKPAGTKRRLFLGGAIALGLLLFLLGLGLLLRSGQRMDSEVPLIPDETSPTPLPAAAGRLEELQADLQAADPSQSFIPLPPVDMQTTLFELPEE